MSAGTKGNGRTYRTLGVNDGSLRAMPRMSHQDLDPQGLLTPEVVRRFIAAAMCPYCPAGPFKTLSGHTNRAHGIDRHELRVAAHLSESQPISSPETRRGAQDRAKRYGFGTDHVDTSTAAKKARSHGPVRQTAAGLDRMRQNIRRVTASTTSEGWAARRRKAWETMSARGDAERQVAAMHLAQGHRTSEEVAHIVNRISADGLTARQVMDQFGYAKTQAHRLVRRAIAAGEVGRG